MKKKVRTFAPRSYQERITARIYDAIKNAREHYANNKFANASPVEACEEFVNRYRHEPEIIQQFIDSKWLKQMPTGYLYIQLL